MTVSDRAGSGVAKKHLQLGLVDRIGGVQDAVDCAARMAKTSSYRLREYPEPENFFDLLINNYKQSMKAKTIQEDLGEEGVHWYQTMSDYQSQAGVPQARLPFVFSLNP